MSCSEDIRRLKNKLSLDFNQPRSSKKEKACQLTTPDLDKLALSTPQMAEYLKTIPPVGPLPTFTRNSDDEKQRMLEMWSNQAHMNNSNFTIANNEIETNTTTTNIEEHDSKFFEKESESSASKNNSKSSKGFQPINMQDQEQAKLERKRLRNRIAASKCRQRKLERIQCLQKKVDEYNDKINALQRFETLLKDVNNQLSVQITKHRDRGCDL
ncbi:uncharacterized protein LOC113799532 [Dermatophagoides pteronyssinus]|uniref:uncharacterized protein LOC113799532 n=1 Tax=Dermatophagoides pteronyssinus TaxID=6956 RepID=UPI003F667F25